MWFLLVMAVVASLVWGVVFVRRFGLVGGLLVLILTGSVFGHAFFHRSVGPIPITGDRVLWLALLLGYVAYRAAGWTEPKQFATCDAVLSLFVVAALGSLLTHNWRIDGAQPAATLLFFYLMPVGAYWIARQVRLEEKHWLAILCFFAVFGLYLGITAICEARGWWGGVFPRYIQGSSYQEFFGRGRGPFLNPIACGIYLTATAAAVGIWMLRLPTQTPRLRQLLWYVLWALPVLLIAVGAYHTKTRSVWLGGAVAALVMLLGCLPRRWSAVMLTGCCFATCLVLATQWDQLNAFKRDRDVSAAEMAESARLRPILATVAWRMFQDRPWVGCGFGQYIHESPYYIQGRDTDLPLDKARGYIQHNLFLSLLTETGLVGLIPFVLLMGIWTRNAWWLACRGTEPWHRQVGLWTLAILAAYLVNAMFHEVGVIPMNNMLLFLACGLSCNLVLKHRPAARVAWSNLATTATSAPACST